MTVKSAIVQSFNIGSQAKGTVQFAGLDRAIGGWGVFGGVGSMSQSSVNTFRTDIQIKLEDPTGVRSFLNYSLPFPVTLSIQQGERLRVYFVKGGLRRPSKQGDFKLENWTPFVTESLETGQLVPITGLPTLDFAPLPGLVVGGIFSALLFIAFVSSGSVGAALFTLLLSVFFVWTFIFRRSVYKRALSEAAQTAAHAAV